jgi:hypothetical protein
MDEDSTLNMRISYVEEFFTIIGQGRMRRRPNEDQVEVKVKLVDEWNFLCEKGYYDKILYTVECQYQHGLRHPEAESRVACGMSFF